MNNELVSIVMLSNHNEQHLKETIKSVQAQTYENWELLYIDDSLEGENLNVMFNEKTADSRINIFSFVFKNGTARARSAALKDAKGRWVTFISIGDVWEPNKLERQIAFMKEHNYAVSYTKYGIIDQNGRDKGIVISGPEHIDKSMMMKCYWSQLLTVMYDAEKIGILRIPNLKSNSGYAVMLLLAKRTDCHLLGECLSSQRSGNCILNSVSFANIFYWRYAAYRVVAKLGRIESLTRTFTNMYYTLIKRVKYVERVE